MKGIFLKRNKEKTSEDVDGLAEKKLSGKSAKQTAEVERLKAKVEALSELRKADTERLTHISEQIGELRNLIFEKEKEIKDIATKTETASDLVNELKPERILSEVKKGMSSVDILKAKIDATDELYKKLLNELKELREKVSMFKGVDAMMKLNKETRESLRTMKRIETIIEKESSKVENIYVHFQKQVNDFQRLGQDADGMERAIKQLEQNFSKLKLKTDTVVWESDVREMREEVNSLHAEIRKTTPVVDSVVLSVSELKANVYGLLQKNNGRGETAILDALSAAVEKLKVDVHNISSRISGINDIELKLQQTDSSMKDVTEKLAGLSNKLQSRGEPDEMAIFDLLCTEIENTLEGNDIHTARNIYCALTALYKRYAGSLPREESTILLSKLNRYFRRITE